jgi:hypothetical protein
MAPFLSALRRTLVSFPATSARDLAATPACWPSSFTASGLTKALPVIPMRPFAKSSWTLPNRSAAACVTLPGPSYDLLGIPRNDFSEEQIRIRVPHVQVRPIGPHESHRRRSLCFQTSRYRASHFTSLLRAARCRLCFIESRRALRQQGCLVLRCVLQEAMSVVWVGHGGKTDPFCCGQQYAVPTERD